MELIKNGLVYTMTKDVPEKVDILIYGSKNILLKP